MIEDYYGALSNAFLGYDSMGQAAWGQSAGRTYSLSSGFPFATSKPIVYVPTDTPVDKLRAEIKEWCGGILDKY